MMSDQRNRRIQQILSDETGHITTDHVLVESWLTLNGRLGHAVANRFVDRALTESVLVEVVVRADIDRAQEIARAFKDQQFSFVDRTSFAVMERLGISRVVSLDEDFVVYRFGPRRRRAFEVLR
jgi:predicted nucleic acid-binding protein